MATGYWGTYICTTAKEDGEGSSNEVKGHMPGVRVPTDVLSCCMQEPRQKIIDIETAVQMLSIAMPPSEPHLAPFISFLQVQHEYKAINLDQWTSFQRFAEEVLLSFYRLHDLPSGTGMQDRSR